MTSLANRAAGTGCACATAVLLASCSPAMDWREVRPEETRLTLLMPCRPKAQQRTLTLAGAPVRLSLHACSAAGQTWGLAHADVADPARIAAALAELRASATTNFAAAAVLPLPLQVPGATPQPASERVRFEGRLPDGRPVHVQLAVFVHGTRVFQATVLGERLSEDGADTFFGSIHFAP